MATFFITGATGRQGSAVVDDLLKANYKVHAWTRNSSSPASQALANRRGVTVFEGEYSDVEAMTAAMKGCSGAFMNLWPHFTSATGELDDAKNVIAAAKAAGVAHLVYSSSASNDKPEIDEHLDPNSWMRVYFGGKRGVEQAVRASGFQHWTILRPAMFMTNFLQPSADAMYPDLLREGTFRTAISEKSRMFLVDPSDVGKFALAVFAEPDKFHQKQIQIATEIRNLREIAEEMAKVSGKKVTLTAMTEAEAAQSPLTEGQILLNRVEFTVDLEEARGWGIPMKGFNEFLELNKESLLKTIGPQ